MTKHIDTARAPKGVLAASRLIKAIVEIGDFAERHYLEVKGPLDLSARPTRAKIAKFILGAANRDLKKSATAFEGYAVLVIGVSDHGIEGIPQVEVLEIEKVVRPYIGAKGPLWDAIWVPVDGTSNHVLIVIVDPPQVGHGPFVCRANGEGVQDGRIYVRGDGETREATSEEFDLLIERGNTVESPAVDFDVQLLGDIRTATYDADETLESYVNRTRDYLLDPLPKPSTGPIRASDLQDIVGFASAFSSMSSVLNYMQTPEDRTEEEYRKQITDWEDRFRSAWPNAIKSVIGYSLSPLAIQLTNRTETFFHDVEVSLHIQGSAIGIPYKNGRVSKSELGLPNPPRRWGPRHNNLMTPYLSPFYDRHDYSISSLAPQRLSWRNTKSIAITLDAGDIRPRASEIFDEEDLVVFVSDSDVDQLHVDWSITAQGFNKVFTGEFDVALGEPLDLTPILSQILDPKKEPEDEEDEEDV
jgi:hypothetical protein